MVATNAAKTMLHQFFFFIVSNLKAVPFFFFRWVVNQNRSIARNKPGTEFFNGKIEAHFSINMAGY